MSFVILVILQKILSMLEWGHNGWIFNIRMYLYDKDILEDVEIARIDPKSMILDIEGHSNV